MSATLNSLLTRAATIRDAFLPEENTAMRVGSLLVDMLKELSATQLLIESSGLDSTALEKYLTENKYAKLSDIPSLAGYATETFVNEALKGKLDKSTFDKLFRVIYNLDGSIKHIETDYTFVSLGDIQSLAYADPIEGGSDGSVVGLLTSWAEYDSTMAKDLALSAELGHGLLGRIQWLEGAGFLTSADISHLASNSVLTAHINDTAVHITAAERAKWNKTATEADTLANLLSNKADKATTLAGYGITDAYTKTALDTLLDGKVSKSGDTMTGALNFGSPNARIANSNNFLILYGGDGMAKVVIGTNEVRRSAETATVNLGTSEYRWANVYANTLNVTSTSLISNLNADLLDGLHASDLFATKTLFTKADYQHYVVLLWKTNEVATHRINGKIYTETPGSLRYQAADIDMWFSRWSSTGYDANLRLVTYGLGTAWKIVTCTYNGEEWYALQHTNIQATAACFVGVSARINFTAVKYYTSNTSTVNNAEIYNSIVDRSNLLKRSYVGGNAIAYITDTVAAADKLSNDATFTAWGQTFFENGVPKSVSGNMTGVGDINTTAANGRKILCNGASHSWGLHSGSGGENRGIYEFTSGIDKWLLYFDNTHTHINHGALVAHAGISSTSIKIELDANGSATGMGGEINRYGASLYLQHRGNASNPTGNILMCCNGGNVGIGTTSPSEKLDVAGTTRTSVLKIGSITLKDVNGHLEIDKTIVSLGDVQSLSASDVVEGGGMIADMLTKWGDYKSTMAETHALSAGLGVELHNRLTGIENSYISRTVADSLYQAKGNYALASSLADYVTVGTAQTITGAKSFTADIAMAAEKKFVGFQPRKKTGGGGWSYSPFVIRGNDHEIFTSLGVYGSGAVLGYIFIGANAYDSQNNMRITPAGNVLAASFVKFGGTSAQFLKADGSVDSNTYLTSHQALDHINVLDTRSVNETTSTYKKELTAHFKYNTAIGLSDGGTYTGLLHFTPWGDASGNSAYELAFTVNGNMWMRNGAIGSEWGAWKKILTDTNYSAVLDDRYVNVSGDTMTNYLTIDTAGKTDAPLRLNSNGTGCYLQMGASGTIHGNYGAVASGPVWNKNGINYTIWHSGNDGAGSGLDADLLDGVHNGDVTAKLINYNNDGGVNQKVQFMQKSSGWNTWDAPTQNYYSVMKLNHGNGDTYYNRTLAFDFFSDAIYAGRMKDGSFKGWRQLAFIDSNVASATNADKTDGYHADINDTANTLVVRDTDAHARISAIRSSRAISADLSGPGWYRVYTSTDSDAYGDTVLLNIRRSYANANNEAYQFSISTKYSAAAAITQLSGVYGAHYISKVRVLRKPSSHYYIDIYYSGTNNNLVCVSGFGAGTFCAPVAATVPDGYTATEFETEQGVKSNNQIISTDSFRLPHCSLTEVLERYLQLASGGNELIFSAGNGTSTMFVNYRAATIGTTVTKWIWCAGSSSTRAAMEMGDLTAANITATSLTAASFVKFQQSGASAFVQLTATADGRVNVLTAAGSMGSINGKDGQWDFTKAYVSTFLSLSDTSKIYGSPAIASGDKYWFDHGRTKGMWWDSSIKAFRMNGTLVVDGDVQSLSNGPDYSGNGIVSFEVLKDQVVKIPATASAVFIKSLLDGDSYTIEFEETPPAEVSFIPIYVYETSPGDGTIKWNGINGQYKAQYTYYGLNMFALIRISSAYFVLRKFSTGS